MHNAIKGSGVGFIVLGTYFTIVSLGSVAGPSVDAGFSEAAVTEPVPEAATSDKKVLILEQAILDAFPEDGSKGSEKAKAFIAGSINTKGYLCADPVDAVKAESQERIYGIKCITNRDGTGVSGYIVDVGTGLVMQLR
jgi:hypothetical protein